MSERYRLKIAGPAVKALSEKLPEKIATAVYAFIHSALLDNPHRVGKPLKGPLKGTWSARRGPWRILYRIDDGSVTVIVVDVRYPSTAYRI